MYYELYKMCFLFVAIYVSDIPMTKFIAFANRIPYATPSILLWCRNTPTKVKLTISIE